jgi:hypothetical protein
MTEKKELTLEEKVAILWEWQRRMHEYAKIDQELGRVSEEFQYQRWALFRDLAKPQAIGEEITR